LALEGEQHNLSNIPLGVLPELNHDDTMNPEKHMDQILINGDIHGIVHDDVMVRVFLQTLISPTNDCYPFLWLEYFSKH